MACKKPWPGRAWSGRRSPLKQQTTCFSSSPFVNISSCPEEPSLQFHRIGHFPGIKVLDEDQECSPPHLRDLPQPRMNNFSRFELLSSTVRNANKPHQLVSVYYSSFPPGTCTNTYAQTVELPQDRKRRRIPQTSECWHPNPFLAEQCLPVLGKTVGRTSWKSGRAGRAQPGERRGRMKKTECEKRSGVDEYTIRSHQQVFLLRSASRGWNHEWGREFFDQPEEGHHQVVQSQVALLY